MSDSSIDFLVIGAQKSATSWLYQCLKEHPEVALPDNKYEVEYLGGDLSQIYGIDWYFGLMSSQQMAIHGDVSVLYLSDPRAPKIVKQYAPNVKLVVVLREPIERAISAYAWSRKNNFLSDYLPSTAEETFRLILNREYDCYPKIKADLAQFITKGFYDNQLIPWFELFDPSNFIIITYDSIKQTPNEVTKFLFSFLGIEKDFLPSSLYSIPKKNNYLNPKPIKNKKWKKLETLKYRINKYVGNLIKQNNNTSPVFELSQELNDNLCSLYRDHVKLTDFMIQKIPEKQKPKEQLVDIWKY